MGFQYKLCGTYAINANVAIRISDSQQKYVVLNAMRRSGGISKNLLVKKLKSKVYVSFWISLYVFSKDAILGSVPSISLEVLG